MGSTSGIQRLASDRACVPFVQRPEQRNDTETTDDGLVQTVIGLPKGRAMYCINRRTRDR